MLVFLAAFMLYHRKLVQDINKGLATLSGNSKGDIDMKSKPQLSTK